MDDKALLEMAEKAVLQLTNFPALAGTTVEGKVEFVKAVSLLVIARNLETTSTQIEIDQLQR